MIIKTSYPFMKPPPSARLIRGHRLAQGFAGLWTMAENGGLQVFDLSGNENHGILIADTHFVPGPFGSALYFDRVGDYVEIDKVDSFNGLSGLTVSVLFNPEVITDNTHYILAAKSDGSVASTAGFRLATKWSGGVQFTIWSIFDTSNASHQLNYGWATAKTGLQNLTGTYDGSYLHLYWNGIEVGTPVAMTGNTQTTAIKLRFGVDNDVLLPFKGLIDHVMIYKRALSASEVAELYAKPFCMLERRARTALMSGYEVVVPPEGIVVLRRRRESA